MGPRSSNEERQLTIARNAATALCDYGGSSNLRPPPVYRAGQGQPTAITRDDTALFFVTNTTGFVWRLAKP